MAAGKVPRRQRERKNGEVEVQRVDPRVMKEALRIAKGDASRIRIISPAKVEIG